MSNKLLNRVFTELRRKNLNEAPKPQDEGDEFDFDELEDEDPSPTTSSAGEEAKRKAAEAARRFNQLEKEVRELRDRPVPSWGELGTSVIDSMVTKVGSALDQLDKETVLPFVQSMPKSPKLDNVVKSYTRAADDYEKSLDNLKPLPRPANVTDAPKIMKQPKLRKRVNTKKFY